ncbi:MAG: geranylgeranyl pyrophosphate synthase [Betaproteobacteria bacterium TMED41]|nr:MAG: geranylgeranyl pyrophosphate synthase [Betaproteobacteria bacterium TMED41]|tara:strand:- start:326 stop:1234 length:909 start_codon:yes stop_codon:yes gene_type:complete
MNTESLLESYLYKSIRLCESKTSPPRLISAIHHAVFPGGARIRPRLSLAVSEACENDELDFALAVACSVEFLHCASLVHDDLPCFDNADFRRGKPSVHKAFDERIAVLTGDALIVLAYKVVAASPLKDKSRLSKVLECISDGVGAPEGIVAGQAWECESKASLRQYQKAKTGALFSAATLSGALASGDSSNDWGFLGEVLGEAYQVADDIRDVIANPTELGKPTGQDESLGRMSSAKELGLSGAVNYFDDLINKAVLAVPICKGAGRLRKLVRAEAQRLVPKKGPMRVLRAIKTPNKVDLPN